MKGKYIVLIAIMTTIMIILFIGLVIYFTSRSSNIYEKGKHVRQPVELVDGQIELCIVHINDFHAQLEEISENEGACKEGEKCIGGIARIGHTVKELKKKHEHVILFNGGDSFYGSSWSSHWAWEVIPYFLNMIHFDVHTLGFHDFDRGLYGLVKYLKILDSKVLVSNIDISQHIELEHLIDFSKHITVGGIKIGIIGVMPVDTNFQSKTEKIKFLDEISTVLQYSKRLVEENDVFINIVVSFCGYQFDKTIASKSKNRISIIIGGKSEILLFNGIPPNKDEVSGPYPTIIQNEDGENVLIVQASHNSKYLGKLLATYNPLGQLINYTGEPIYMDNNIPKDKHIVEKMFPWQQKAKIIEDESLGSSEVSLNSKDCNLKKECALGSLLADVLLDYCSNKTGSVMALVNSRSVIGGIAKGNITFGQLFNVLPYGFTWNCGNLEGRYIKKILEYGMTLDVPSINKNIGTVNVAGILYYISLRNSVGDKIGFVEIHGKEVKLMEDEEIYNVGLVSYISDGKGLFRFVPGNIRNIYRGQVDIKIFKEYIKNHSPIKEPKYNRVIFKE